MPSQEKLVTHELGHLIVAYHFGCAIQSIVTGPTSQDAATFVDERDLDPSQKAILALAGYVVAEEKLKGSKASLHTQLPNSDNFAFFKAYCQFLDSGGNKSLSEFEVDTVDECSDILASYKTQVDSLKRQYDYTRDSYFGKELSILLAGAELGCVLDVSVRRA